MKKFLIFVLAFMLSLQYINAHPITITISNGMVFVVDSDDYPTKEKLIQYVLWLEEPYGNMPYVPGVSQ